MMTERERESTPAKMTGLLVRADIVAVPVVEFSRWDTKLKIF